MLGLKLNHVSKRGQWCTAVAYSNMPFIVLYALIQLTSIITRIASLALIKNYGNTLNYKPNNMTDHTYDNDNGFGILPELPTYNACQSLLALLIGLINEIFLTMSSRSKWVHRTVLKSKTFVLQTVINTLSSWTSSIATATMSISHYDDVIMGPKASQITSLTIVYSTVYSDADQRKHQSSASLAFVRGIHQGPVNSPHKWPVSRKMFPFHDVIMMFRTIPYQRRHVRLDCHAWPGVAGSVGECMGCVILRTAATRFMSLCGCCAKNGGGFCVIFHHNGFIFCIICIHVLCTHWRLG